MCILMIYGLKKDFSNTNVLFTKLKGPNSTDNFDILLKCIYQLPSHKYDYFNMYTWHSEFY